MKVITIIVTYNGSRWMEKCLNSLRQSTVPSHILVIDNASSDDTVAVIRTKYPEVELIESPKNLGFGQANNIGLRKALAENADYVLLLNQDAWVGERAIEKMIDIAKANYQYGILSPYHYNYNGDATEKYFEEWVLQHYTPEYNLDKTNGTVKEVYTSSFVHAACWLMPVATIRKVGGFDPLFFHYGEDNDFVQRLHACGLKVAIVPGAGLFHQGTNWGLSDPGHKRWFQVIQSLLLFKNPAASEAGALILFLKQIIKIHFSGNAVRASAYRKNLGRLFKMIKSRREQQKPLAYLS